MRVEEIAHPQRDDQGVVGGEVLAPHDDVVAAAIVADADGRIRTDPMDWELGDTWFRSDGAGVRRGSGRCEATKEGQGAAEPA